jgi:putative aldouronate transport system permease protein
MSVTTATQPKKLRSAKLGGQIARGGIHIFLLIIGLLCLLPMWLVVVYSFSDDVLVAEQGISLLPQGFSLDAYRFIFTFPEQVIRSYAVTILVAGLGTVGGIAISSMLGYALSRSYFSLRRGLVFYCVFTMLFSAGMVPTYLVVKTTLRLHKSPLAVLVLTTMVIPWYIMMFRAYFAGLPPEILESARIDGAGEWRLFFNIALPLARPWLATIGLMYILKYWNEWIPALLYVEDPKWYPLQYLLQVMMRNVQALQAMIQAVGTQVKIPGPSLRMAMVVVAAGPAMFVFMLLQRYFVRGITAGAVKG